MSQRLPFARRFWLAAGLAMAVSVGALQAAPSAATMQKTVTKLLSAIAADDRNAFVANGTDAVKEGMTQQVMDNLSKQLGPHLKKGYTATYLTDLKQAGHQAYLWKVRFKDGSDDLVVRLVLDKSGKVAGFLLQ